jgi:putative CocE/NonD family hydrolase
MRLLRSVLVAGLSLCLPSWCQQIVEVLMRDGVRLSTEVYGGDPAQPKPVLLARTPYDKKGLRARAEAYAREGYVVVIQDCRGRFASQGDYMPYNNDKQDGYDTLEWIHGQKWSNGRCGMFGGSHLGVVQWLAAAEGPAGLVALTPAFTASSLYRVAYRAGALRMALIASAGPRSSPVPAGRTVAANIDLAHEELPLMHLPLARLEEAIGWPMPWMTGVLAHADFDGFWSQTTAEDAIPRTTVPAQIVSGYYDLYHHESVQDFERARRRKAGGPVQLILGPWTHGGSSRSKVQDVDFGSVSMFNEPAAALAWFDRFVKQKPGAPFPLVHYFSMGENRWYDANAWPPSGSKPVSVYLHTGRKAGMQPASGAPSRFTNDPSNPTPSVPGGRKGVSRAALWSPMDLSDFAKREDVLSFTSVPLSAPLRFAGPITAEIWGESDTADADWVVRVIDVRPDGFAMGLAHGIVRARYRNGEAKPEPMTPGRVYRFDIDLGSVAARIDRGHRIRIVVAGGSFPQYDRNLHTGSGPGETAVRVAHQTVRHESKQASRVILPVLP